MMNGQQQFEVGVASYNYDAIRAKALRGPRVTSQLRHFEDIAKGLTQVPIREIAISGEFLQHSEELREYGKLLCRNLGTFYKHLCASIPFLPEEHCRLGVALYRLAKHKKQNQNSYFSLYETSSADAANARTLAEYSGGLVRTLSDTPNPANVANFRSLCLHSFSDIHLGPFVDITPSYLSQLSDRPYFSEGFDVIYENTTFQMYGEKPL